MRYWWVNQNQTYKHELGGGCLWSPKRNANGVRNPFYESMREVAPSDLVFSFVDTRIAAIGVAESYCYERPKPEEFGGAGMNWEAIGWRLRVRFTNLVNRIRPKEHIDLLHPLLPDRYSPLQRNGNGIQSVYLTPVPEMLAAALIALIGPVAVLVQQAANGADQAMTAANADLEVWEHHIESELDRNTGIPTTEREALIIARRGQGLASQLALTPFAASLLFRTQAQAGLRCCPHRGAYSLNRIDAVGRPHRKAT